MTMINNVLIMLATGIFAGTLGSLLGIGGGMIITPIVTLALGMDIKYAIGASIVAVIATSSGSTIAYLKDDVLNLRVAMYLEIFTTIGAIVGALLAGFFPAAILYFFFGALLVFSGWNMLRKMRTKDGMALFEGDDAFAQKLRLNATYYDKNLNQQIDYKVTNVPLGSLIMLGAGLASGMLGIGSGAFKVMAMDNAMKMPLKPSSATSNLMMGVTAAASATVYFLNGSIKPTIAVPLALGILVGAAIGTRIMPYLPTKVLRGIFIPILAYLGLQMIVKAFGGNI